MDSEYFVHLLAPAQPISPNFVFTCISHMTNDLIRGVIGASTSHTPVPRRGSRRWHALLTINFRHVDFGYCERAVPDRYAPDLIHTFGKVNGASSALTERDGVLNGLFQLPIVTRLISQWRGLGPILWDLQVHKEHLSRG